MRWINSVSIDKLHGIRLMNAHPQVMSTFASTDEGIGNELEEIATRAAGGNDDDDDASSTRLLLVRMARLGINHRRNTGPKSMALSHYHGALRCGTDGSIVSCR